MILVMNYIQKINFDANLIMLIFDFQCRRKPFLITFNVKNDTYYINNSNNKSNCLNKFKSNI